MALTLTEKELAAVAISVAAGCKPCTTYHVNAAHKSSASEEEIQRAVTDAARIRRGASEIMLRHGLGQAVDRGDLGVEAEPTRTKALIAVGAAYAVNCTSSLKRHLETAEALGIGAGDIDEIVQMARFIKQMAVSHVEKLVHRSEEAPAQRAAAGADARRCCG